MEMGITMGFGIMMGMGITMGIGITRASGYTCFFNESISFNVRYVKQILLRNSAFVDLLIFKFDGLLIMTEPQHQIKSGLTSGSSSDDEIRDKITLFQEVLNLVGAGVITRNL